MSSHEIDVVINLFQYFRDEIMIPDAEYDEDRILNFVRQYSINYNLFFEVAWEGQRPVGFVGGFLTEDPVVGAKVAGLQVLFLLDSHKSTTNYQQLVQPFEEWAKMNQCKVIRCIDVGYRPNRLNSVLEDLNFQELPTVLMGKDL